MTSFNERTNTLLYKKYVSLTLYSERIDVSVVCERWVKTGTDGYIDPTSSLDHSTLCYLQEPTYLFFSVLAAVAQPGVAEGHGSQSASWASVCKLALTLAFLCPTNSTAASTCLYSFITYTCFRFFFRLFTQVHLWLRARSRVNIYML